MNLKKIKMLFTKNLLVITILFPLIIIFFYGISLSIALKYQNKHYSQQELKRYENELRNNHKKFLIEKAKYIESFMNFLYLQNRRNFKVFFEQKILTFIESLKKYDSGFIFIFKKDGTLIKHPCAKTLISFQSDVAPIYQDNILEKLIEASELKQFVYYQGTDCVEERFVKKIAYIHHIRDTDLYIVISKNEKEIDYSIQQQKELWQKKIDDELQGNIKLLILVSIISVIFSLFFSKIINILIKDYEKEIKDNHKVMFSQSRLAQAGELLSMIAHQWRQPISKIASVASNLRFQIMVGENVERNILDKKLYEIEEYTEFLSETIDDFREFYKPKKEKEVTFILPLIDKSLRFLENEISKKSINMIKKFDKDIALLLYENELMQVVINVVQNAIEFSEKGATIKIQTYLKDEEYWITITDHAGGIDPLYIDQIFDAHFSTKTASNSPNLGLGLYVSKVIIEKHFGGKLEVESLGNSSTFTIRLIRNDR
ncbi:MAG: cache domain-containing protein [Epsilonproteobacteria bacterium]|nr:cache domain-containing protein [Campylobacterota bacterium]